MAVPMAFAQRMKEVRELKGLSLRDLSKVSGVDYALINKVERGIYPSTLRASTIKAISDGLGLTDQERLELLRLARSGSPVRGFFTIPPPLPTQGSTQCSRLPATEFPPAQPELLLGVKDVAERALHMVESLSLLPPPDEPHKEEILVTTLGESSIFDERPDLRPCWYQALAAALARGWDCIAVIRLTENIGHEIGHVTELRALLGFEGDYLLRYVSQVGSIRPAYNVFVVPRIGALWLFSVGDAAYSDVAWYYPLTADGGNDAIPDPHKSVEAIIRHFFLLFDESHQLFRRYQPASFDWEDALTRVMQQSGDEFVANDTADNTWMPTELYSEYADRSVRQMTSYGSQHATIRNLVAQRQHRRKAFEQGVERYRYRDILPKETIIRLVSSKQYHLNPWWPEPAEPIIARPEQVAQHLQAIVDNLQKHPNYELGLMEHDQAEDQRIYVVPWLVKGEHTVLVEAIREAGTGERLIWADLEITAPSIVGAFRQLFLDLWEDIPPENRDRREVINWLRAQISQVLK